MRGAHSAPDDRLDQLFVILEHGHRIAVIA